MVLQHFHLKEPEFDAMSVGHSSTSISEASMDEALNIKKNKNIFSSRWGNDSWNSIWGYDACDNLKNNLKIMPNDNDMSISKNKGGLSDYLAKIWVLKIYKKLKSSGKKVLKICLMGFILQEILKMGLSLQWCQEIYLKI